MHKIKKGIKKKIKGKKGKDKEDDLFDPEQLAKYKKELEEAAAAAASAEGNQFENPDPEDEVESQTTKAHEEDEEWQKFKLLTSGIDSVLKKTSGDLDRIKTTSFFQRTKPNPAFILPTSSKALASSGAYARPASAPQPSSATPEGKQKKGPRWVDVETGHQSEEEDPQESHQEDTVDGPGEQGTGECELEEKEPESPEVEAIVVDDDLFDTSFVDAVATGEIKLAYIPDSPTEEEQGDDPFDTSAVADVVKKIEEEERKKKRQVNLGLAVNVLTGKPLEDSNNPQAATVKGVTKDVTQGTRRPRPRNINLLGDFDADPTPANTSPKEDPTSSERPADLFDTLLETSPLEAGDIVAVVPIKKVSPSKEERRSNEPDPTNLNLHELLSEFDVISAVDEPAVYPKLEDNWDDEFAALAAESLHKEPSSRSATQSPAPSRPPPPSKPPPPVTPAVEEPEDDPFDTTFVTNIPLGKSELKIVESQLLDCESESKVLEEDDFDFDPRAGEEPGFQNLQTNLPIRRDLLGGSSSDLSSLSAVDPIRPESNGLIETEIHDPFDTSVVENLLPGKAELKLLEAELLAGDEVVDEDFHDFDPRKDETRLGNPSVTVTQPIAPRRPPPPKVPEIHPLDLIDESQSQIKALTPQTEITDFQDQIDPFDTSSVSGAIVPGKFELKLLESELVEDTSISAGAVIPSASSSACVTETSEFNPREAEEVPVASLVETVPQDIFDSPSHPGKDKPLIPTINQKEDVTFQDPFDTSNLVNQNIPGKAELRYLEKELLNSIEDFQPPSLPAIPQVLKPERPLTPEQIREPHPLELDEDQDFFGGGHEPLQPLTPSNLQESLVFDDPFDTSIANTIAPGRAELKILEKELASDSFSNPGFNPRATSTLPTAPLVPQTVAPIKTSEIADLDPFDTSAANDILPGKAELKQLEAELL